MFEVLDKKKGIYIDEHEREDVLHRAKFLRFLIAGGFFNKDHAPTSEAIPVLFSSISSIDHS